MPAIKKLLGDITDGQRRQAEIDDRRAAAEERIASAMEKIALGFFEKKAAAADFRIAPENVRPVSVGTPAAPEASENLIHDGSTDAFSPVTDRKSVLDLIGVLRKEQFSYEKIARTLESQGIPTFSGKGAWHSQTVSKLCHQFHPSLAQTS